MKTILQSRTPVLFAGRLRNRIDIINRNPVQDSTGGTVQNAGSVYATVWASIEAVAGQDGASAGSFVSTATHQVVIRFLAGVESSMLVKYAGRTFQITQVLNPDERPKLLVLNCVEINDSVQQ